MLHYFTIFICLRVGNKKSFIIKKNETLILIFCPFFFFSDTQKNYQKLVHQDFSKSELVKDITLEEHMNEFFPSKKTDNDKKKTKNKKLNKINTQASDRYIC